MEMSNHELDLMNYINSNLHPLCAIYEPGYGVAIYPSADAEAIDTKRLNYAVEVRDDDTDMALLIYSGFNSDRIGDIDEEVWCRLYEKLEKFVIENLLREAKRMEDKLNA
ncbi:hypothetical protein [Limosilactobacillus sp.]|uniref:hypothetical protein n=1 Tax=Limosilactobacillus sp. TaxID=2773925 RepID=UPI003F0E41BD